jgi:predicted permease
MNNFLQDLRFGIRTLLKAPGFTAIAILTLALGIGANSALFSVVNGVLLNPLPFHQPDMLMSVYTKSSDFSTGSVSYVNYLDWEKQNQSFSSLGIFRDEDLFLTGTGEGERLRAYQISAGFFPALQVQPILGRLIRPEEDRIGGTPIAMIGEGLWRRKFSSSPDIIGKQITLSGKSYEIVGVIPTGFKLYSKPRDVYVPIGQWDDPTFRTRGISFGANVVGRLKAGVTLSQVRGDMDRVAANLAVTYPDSNKGSGIAVIPLKQDMVGDVRPLLLVLLGAVGFVLLIACANVANLLLARATGRTREFAIRAALGASRGRMIRQLLTEAILLGTAGGAVGLTVTYWGTRAIIGALPQALPRASDVKLDTRVLLFTLGVSIGVGILFGLVPALRMSRASLQETLKEGGRGASGARHKAQSVFVAVEVAMALVLLVGAGLMVRSIAALWGVNPGFNAHGVMTFDMTMPIEVAANPSAQRALLRSMHSALVTIPGVKYASLQGGSLPMNGDSELPYWVEGKPKPAAVQDMTSSLFYLVEPQYLEAMGTPLLRGRFLNEQDTEHSEPVVVIDEVFAKKEFANQDPIGKRLNLAIVGTQPMIVGVAAHVKHFGLDADAKATIQEQMYIPFMQLPDKFMPLVANGIGLVARISEGAQGTFSEAVRKGMTQANPGQVVYNVGTMEEIVANSLAARRFTMILLGVFAGLALVLASVGIYGVISYIVGQRTHEIGIRVALGAQRGDILRLVIGQGGAMALIGVGVGLAAAIPLSWWLLKSLVFGVTSTDPLTLVGVSVLLTAVALLACYVPARRAMKTDPVIALRYE